MDHKCSLKEVLDILGGKWALPIIYTLSKGTLRFKELERSIPNINTRMLVKELKNMETNEILNREVFATVPPTVEYSLTKKGLKLVPIIKELHKWGLEYSN
ncbi:MAG: helix-turn-helix transcriptional regulator [Saprospiraceae bacterium]|nr:helix-turn-helix transcriptional regulator [Saprospiraceae bacterium]